MLDVIQEYEDMKAKADPSVQKSHNPNIAKAKGFAKAVLAGQNSQAAQAPKASTQKTNTVQWFIGQYQQLQKAMKNFTAKPNAADKNTILRLLNDVSANNYDKFSLNEKKQIWKAAGSKSAYMNDVNQANGIVALQGLASVGQGTSRNPFPVFDATRKAAVKVFKTAKDADSVLRTNLEKVWAAATTAEREAAFIYSYSFSQFQESMRFGCYGYGSGRLVPLNRVDWDNLGVGTMGKKRGEVKNNIKNLTSMIDKSSCPHDVRLERGTRLDGIAALFGVSISKLQSGDTNTLNAMLVGKVGKDEGFTSCGSSTGSGFSSYPAILHIDCPAGTKMLYMEPFAAYGGDAPYDAAAMYNTSRKPWSYWDGKSKQKNLATRTKL